VSCDICNKTVKTKDSSTSNLYNHLSSTHPDEYALLGAKQKNANNSSSREKQQTLKSLLERKDKYPSESHRHKHRTGLVTDFLSTGRLTNCH
jgi:ribulose kinase